MINHHYIVCNIMKSMENEGEIPETGVAASGASVDKQAENPTFGTSIEDKRIVTDEMQVALLIERLRADKVAQALEDTHRLLDIYSRTSPEELKIQLVDGNVGEGTINGSVIEIQLPAQTNVVTQMRGFVEQHLQGKADEKIDRVAKEFVYALVASTVLHEGVHGLLDSRPGSQFAQDFERVSGESNEQGRLSTLLDEGIAYAVQGIYAPQLQPVGSLKPVARESEPPEVYQRKVLGEKLRPIVQAYIEQGKAIDDEFFTTTSELMEQL